MASADVAAPSPPDTSPKAEKDVQASTCNMVSIVLVCFLPTWVVIALFSRIGVGLDLCNALADKTMSLQGDGCVCLAALLATGLYIIDWSGFQSMRYRVLTAIVPLTFLALGCLLKIRKYPWGPMLMVLFMTPLLISAIRYGFCKNMNRSSFYVLVSKFCFANTSLVLVVWVAWMFGAGWQWGEETKAKLIMDSAELYNSSIINTESGVQLRLNYAYHCSTGDLENADGVVIANRNLNSLRTYIDKLSSLPEDNVLCRTHCTSDCLNTNDWRCTCPSDCLEAYLDSDLELIGSDCTTVGTVWFMVWACPFICFAFDGALALFCLLQGSLLVVKEGEGVDKMERTLKRFMLLLVLCLGGMYGSASISGASLRLGSMLMAFFVSAVVAVTIFTVLENPDIVKVAEHQIEESKLMALMRKGWQSDWAKAFFVGGTCLFVPPYLLVNRLKTMYLLAFRPKSKCAMEAQGVSPPPKFHGIAKTVFETMSHWYWVGILHKVNLLSELFFVFQVGVAKATYVFLSYLNFNFFVDDNGADWPIVPVIAIIYVIGFIMFMLPPVPGIPVYIFCGVVIAKPREGMNQILSIVIAIFVAFSLKILASCGQYGLGYTMGKSVKIQQLIGVDKVPTRALEKILHMPGLSLPKVAVLVGGPDWPTSITCGILKLNVLQMIIGTCPVIIPMIPSVLAGAFLAQDASDPVWSMLSTAATSATVVFQAIPQALMLYYLATIIEKNQQELQQPRAEHAAVEALTLSEVAFEQTYREVTDWKNLGGFLKLILIVCTGLNLMSQFLFTMAGELCFRSFSVSNKILDPFVDGGLRRHENDGPGTSSLNVVRTTADGGIGEIPLGMFFLCALMHYIFLKLIGCRAASAFKNKAPEVPATPIGAADPSVESL